MKSVFDFLEAAVATIFLCQDRVRADDVEVERGRKFGWWL